MAQVMVREESLGALPEWNLADLYPGPDSVEYRRDLDHCDSRSRAFEDAWKGRLGDLLASDPAGLAGAIAEYESIQEIMGRIMSHASLAYAADTADPARSKALGDAQERITAASSHLLFFELELNRLDETALSSAMISTSALAYWRPWIEDLRKERPHQLEDRVEQLFHDKSVVGRTAWNRLFDDTMSALSFTIGGKALSLEPALTLLIDPVREVRAEAAQEISRVLSGNARLFTLVTNTLAKDKEISDRWRGFRDVADSRHLSNRVEPEVVNALVSAVESAFPRISHRYYAMKAQWLGLDRLKYWDRNAPLEKVPEPTYPWEKARTTVLEAYAGFAPEMAEIAGRFFERNWIDAPVRPGKSPGAFAHPTVPSVHPYVMLNYLGKPGDVMTLAHELGHGVHQVLASAQGTLMSQTPLTLAETASVFGEMLTFRHMLDRCEDQAQRRAMLARKVEGMINTVVRQIAFYLFERKVHTERLSGELTQERLGEIWMEVQHASLGPAFDLDADYRIWWSYIPHFIHSPFYVYAYAFGDCLVNSLYAVYQQSESGFRERYFDMLRAGGTRHHSELLKPFGLDASEPSFWNKGLSMLESLIDELAELDRGMRQSKVRK
jgi:oligoendopeptidase F